MHAFNEQEEPQIQFQTINPTDPVVEELSWFTKFKGPELRLSDCNWIFRFPNCEQRSGYIQLGGFDFYWTSCFPWDFLQLAAADFDSAGQKIGHIGINLAPKSKTVKWFRFRFSSINGPGAVMVQGESKRFDAALAEALGWDFKPRVVAEFEWFQVNEDCWKVELDLVLESLSLYVSTTSDQKWNWSRRLTIRSTNEEKMRADGNCANLVEAMTAAADSIDKKFRARALA